MPLEAALFDNDRVGPRLDGIKDKDSRVVGDPRAATSVASLLSVTVAPGTMAPEVSITVPVTAPVIVWAEALSDTSETSSITNPRKTPISLFFQAFIRSSLLRVC
jgi:hypothetical protein